MPVIDNSVSEYLRTIGRKGGLSSSTESKSRAGKLGWTVAARAKRALNGRKTRLIKASG